MLFSAQRDDSLCLLDIFILHWKELSEKTLNTNTAQVVHTDWAPNFLTGELK